MRLPLLIRVVCLITLGQLAAANAPSASSEGRRVEGGGAWGFEEGSGSTALDSSGNGNSGTLTGPIWTTGRIGGGLSFDGVDDRIEVPDAESLDFTSAITISAWVKPSSAPNDTLVLVKQSLTAGWSYALHFTGSGHPHAVFRLDNTFFEAVIPTQLPVGEWSHLAATYDGEAIRLYLNGELRGASPAPSAPQ